MDPGLLAEIEANPDDDGPRLVLADQLQHAGDPRGELIAVQCELAKRGAPPYRLYHEWIGDALVDTDITDLRKRERKLLRAHGKQWTYAARAFAVGDGDVHLRRGFVEHVRWDCARFLSHGLGPLLEVAPLVRAVQLGTQIQSGLLTKFYRRKECRRLRELYVLETTGIANAPLQLSRLDLNHPGGPHDLRDVAGAPWFGALEALTLTAFKIDDDDMAALLAAKAPLRELQLITSRCGSVPLARLAASPVARTLEILSLRYAKLVAGDVARIFTPKRWPKLRALDLRSNALDADDVAALAELPALKLLAR